MRIWIQSMRGRVRPDCPDQELLGVAETETGEVQEEERCQDEEGSHHDAAFSKTGCGYKKYLQQFIYFRNHYPLNIALQEQENT